MSSLSPVQLVSAYAQGFFPMADDNGQISWYNPDPRAIIPLDESFHVPRSLRRRMKHFEIRVDTAFEPVMRACAESRPRTWISEEFIRVYTQLHEVGLAHSVEVYQAGDLVGGLYGVALKGFFAGESMFSFARDASKVALVDLVARLRRGGYTILDSQFYTPHLARFGLVEIPRAEYQGRLKEALAIDAKFVTENETDEPN